jgi:hypothetical protein
MTVIFLRGSVPPREMVFWIASRHTALAATMTAALDSRFRGDDV